MDAFKIILEYIILISFPTLMYLIYLFTNRNIKSKGIYFILSLLSSIYLIKCFGSNMLLSFLVLSIIVIISYIYNYLLPPILFSILILSMYMNSFNNIYTYKLAYLCIMDI